MDETGVKKIVYKVTGNIISNSFHNMDNVNGWFLMLIHLIFMPHKLYHLRLHMYNFHKINEITNYFKGKTFDDN